MDTAPPDKQTHDVIRMDLFGHSLAAEGGASQLDFGAWHKIASHLQPALLNSAAQGGAIACYSEGGKMYPTASATYSGYARVLAEAPLVQRGTVGPYLPTSQMVCIWYGANDLGVIGPANNMAAFKEGLRTILARVRAAAVFENNFTFTMSGLQPVTYTGTWSQNAGAWGFASGDTYASTSTAYPTNKVTLKIPPDYGAGVISVTVPALTGGLGGVWSLVDVTAGGSTTLFSGWDTRNLAPKNHASGTNAQSSGVTKRTAIGAAPTTITTADFPPDAATLTVASTAAFDTAGALWINNTERVTYTGKTSTTFTGITRAVANTFATLALSGVSVTGTRTFELRPTTVSTVAWFDCFALEALQAPLTFVMKQNRIMNYTIWSNWPYGAVRTKLGSGTSVGATSITVASTTLTANALATGDLTVADSSIATGIYTSVIVDSEVMWVTATPNATTLTVSANRGTQGTTAATHTNGANVYPWIRVGDTITIGSGANAETRTVTSVAGATIGIGSFQGGPGPLANTHSAGDVVLAGIQEADVRQVMNPAIQSVCDEFNDPYMFTVDPEVGLSGSSDAAIDPTCFAGDGVHFSDEGHARLAAYFLRVATPKMTSYKVLSRAAQPDRLAFFDSAYNQITFSNGWSSYTITPATVAAANGNPAPFGFRKDFVTRRVRFRGAIKNTSQANAATIITNLGLGCRPATDQEFWVGPHRLQIKQNGDMLFPEGLSQVAYVPLDNIQFEAGG
jgi:hypothetical protein